MCDCLATIVIWLCSFTGPWLCMHAYLNSGIFCGFQTIEIQQSDNQTTGCSAWEVQETAASSNSQARQ